MNMHVFCPVVGMADRRLASLDLFHATKQAAISITRQPGEEYSVELVTSLLEFPPLDGEPNLLLLLWYPEYWRQLLPHLQRRLQAGQRTFVTDIPPEALAALLARDVGSSLTITQWLPPTPQAGNAVFAFVAGAYRYYQRHAA